MSGPPTVAFVVPRYGEGFSGGVEAQCRRMAMDARAAGWSVTVLTTTAGGLPEGPERFPPGPAELDGISIARFRLDSRRVARFAPCHHRLAISPRSVPAKDRETWAREGVVEPAFYDALAAAARVCDAVVFLPYLPYLFNARALDVEGISERAVVVPCLHDEGAAHAPEVRALLARCALVLFNCEAERDFAVRRLGVVPRASIVLGEHVPDVPSTTVEPPHEAGPGSAPYVLCCGRVEAAKGTPWLARLHARHVRSHPTAPVLALAGSGDAVVGDGVRSHGFVSADALHRLMAGALALVNPSRLESFSLVVMESWLHARPVIVNRRCAVTRSHVERSGGGLLFDDLASYASALDALARDPAWADELGRRGQEYVRARYSHDVVASRMRRAIEGLRHATARP